MSQTDAGQVLIRNTERRKSGLILLVDKVLQLREMSSREALSMRGRLAFAESHVFGRSDKHALQAIARHAFHRPFAKSLDEKTCLDWSNLEARILDGPPRRVKASVNECFFLFTDASFNDQKEGGLGALGAALFNCRGHVISWFSLSLDPSWGVFFMTEGQQVAIGELQTLAVLLAVLTWF